MSIIEILLLAFALSMDAFAVSVCKGLATKQLGVKQMCIVGAWFGGFQALMPSLGYLLGSAFEKYITRFDHWIAFVLLGLLGVNMIREALSKAEEEAKKRAGEAEEYGKTAAKLNAELPRYRERAQAAGSEHYLLSANGIAETGEIINIDGAGNRVASAIYGHKKVWIIAGKNKLAPTYDEALWRARNIAAPKNAQRLHAKTPCAVKADHCYDCKSPGRICRALTVLWGAMMGSDMEVVLVNEDLGY